MPSPRWPNLLKSRVFFAVVITLLIVAVYAPSWRLPLFQDDIDHFVWIGSQNVGTFWTYSPFGYYRPLTQTVWKIGALIAGRFDPAMLHWVSLIVHVISTLLAGTVIGGWLPDRRRSAMWLAGALFALYPFTFQVVPFVGALFHPLATLLLLGTLAGHQAYRSTGSRAALTVSLGCALLAPFAHESGLIAGGLLVLSEAAWAWRQRRRPAWPILTCAAVASAFGLGVWLLVPKTGSQTPRPDFDGIVTNLTYAVQGLAYPIGPLMKSITVQTGASDRTVIWIGGGLIALILGAVAWRAGRLRVWAAGLGLWLIGALPYSLTLTPSYTLSAPRLLYVTSIGTVLVWTAGLTGLAHPIGRWRAARIMLAVLGVAGILVFSAWFIRTRMPFYERLAGAFADLAEAAQADAGQPSALVVNFPRLARPTDTVFPIGVESPVFFGPDANLHDALRINGFTAPAEVRAISFGSLMPALDYAVKTVGPDVDWPALAAAIASADRVYRSYPAPDAIPVRYTGRLVESVAQPPLVKYGGSVALISADMTRIGDRLSVALQWEYSGGADSALVFVHVVNGQGELIAQSDGPVLDMLPFWQWPAGRRVEEVRTISLAGRAGAGQVRVGLYDAVTGARLAPLDRSGHHYADGAVPLFDLPTGAESVRPLIGP